MTVAKPPISRLIRPSRRSLLGMGAGLLGLTSLGGLGLPLSALGGAPVVRRFLFVFARGGWDTTRVFSPMFAFPRIDSEPVATTAFAGGLPYVDHPDRPAVRAFFERHASRTAVIDGMLVRSVNHAVCERLVLTGGARPDASDWPSMLGAAVASEHAMPTIILSGPMVPGRHARTTGLAGAEGQLQGLIDGTELQRGDQQVPPIDGFVESAVSAVLASRAEAALQASIDPARTHMLDAFVDSLQRMDRLDADARQVQFTGDTFEDQLDTAVDLLAHNVARAAVVGLYGFDTHARNTDQSALLQALFSGLDRTLARLAATPGLRAPSMADETVVVVLSEMGRTPYLNVNAGKDHWPYTAAMLIGPGVRGGRRIGDYDDYLNGRPVDLASGDVTASGTVITPKHLGATLLTLGGLDPADWGVDEPAIGAALA